MLDPFLSSIRPRGLGHIVAIRADTPYARPPWQSGFLGKAPLPLGTSYPLAQPALFMTR